MRFRLCIVFVLLFIPAASFAQMSLVSHWEKVGPVNFTALVHQSPTQIVAATDHGYLYITDDDGITWRRQEVSDTVNIEDITYGDSLHGALIASGNLMLTSDGGATWNAHSAPIDGLMGVGALGKDTLFIAGMVWQNNNWAGKLFRSTNAGTDWDTVMTDVAADYWSAPMKIAFFFGREFIVGGSLYAESSDGGAHWTSQTLNGTIRDIDFFNRDTGAIASSSGYYVTTDGGTNWTFTPEFHDERDDNYNTVKFFGPSSFFMFGSPNAYYYTSNDLGASVSLAQMRQASSIRNVIGTANGAWLATGSGGTILSGTFTPEVMTTPQWTVIAECPFGPGVNLHASNGSLLQCLASSYPLLSTDSGFFWHVSNEQYPQYTGMHFTSVDTGYLYNGGWLSYSSEKTTDSGHTWKPYAMNPANLYSPSFGAGDTGYGISGSFVRTTDGGMNWLPESIPFPTVSPYAGYQVYQNYIANIAAIDGLDAFVLARISDTLVVRPAGKAYYYGEKSYFVIYKTSDAGTTWTQLTNAPTPIRAIYFHNTSLGFILSDSGRIYRTPDGGNTWTMEQPATSHYVVNSIKFLNDNIGFLTLDTEAVMSTTDAGLTWTWLPIPTNREEILERNTIFIYGQDTIQNLSGMNTEGIFFPDSSTVLISFDRALLNINIPPKDTVINGDTIVIFDPSINQGVHEDDYGFYRAKLNIPPTSAVRESPLSSNAGLAISLYPNPARDEVRVAIASPLTQNVNIEVLDMLGASVLTSKNVTDNVSLDLRSLPNGVFMLRCSSGDRSGTKIFTIAR